MLHPYVSLPEPLIVVSRCWVFSVLVLATLSGCAGSSDPPVGTGFPTNANGESFGTAMDAHSPEEEPDLILVAAANGAVGYVRKTVTIQGLGRSLVGPS